MYTINFFSTTLKFYGILVIFISLPRLFQNQSMLWQKFIRDIFQKNEFFKDFKLFTKNSFPEKLF